MGQDDLFSGFSYSSGMSISSLLLEDRFWNIEFLVDYFGWLWFLVFVFYETESQYLADGPEMDSKTDSNLW